MSIMKNELEKKNQYFHSETVQNGRILFRFRCDLIEAKCNFKNKAEYKAEKFLCDSCETEQDENTHVLYCSSYQDLRAGKDLQSDHDLACYLQKVMQIRTKLRLSR